MPRKRAVPVASSRSSPTMTIVPATPRDAELLFCGNQNTVLMIRQQQLWVYEYNPAFRFPRRATPTVLAGEATIERLMQKVSKEWHAELVIINTEATAKYYPPQPIICQICGNYTSVKTP